MPGTLTCSCGKRLTVGSNVNAKTVLCPECGRSLATAGNGRKAAGLTFGVKKVDERRETPSPDDSRIAFFCPGCGKQFRETARAAGKPTQCPKCATEFAIPAVAGAATSGSPTATSGAAPASATDAAGGSGPPPVPVEFARPESSVRPADAPAGESAASAAEKEEAVAAAVAAYTGGRIASAERRGARWVPIGLLLLVLGGILSTTGSYLMVKGYMTAFGLEDLLSGGGANIDAGVLGQMGGYQKLLNELLNDADGQRNPQNDPQPPQSTEQLKELLARQGAGEGGKSLDEVLKDREEKRSRGQSMLLWGVVAGGTGKLLMFVGGIFLLAGLICRFLRPRPVAPAAAGSQ